MQVLIAIDQLLNTFLGGWADETLSARSFRQSHEKRWAFMMRFIDVLFFWEEQHCYNAYLSEQERRQLPVEYRG